jgi:hypothetical protein
MLERMEECATCGTGFAVRACSKCATGYAAWNIWFTTVAPPELKDHTGRISPENKRLLDGILDADFGGRATVQNIAAAVAIHLQRAKEVAAAQAQASFDALVAREIAAATELLARNLDADRHLAARLQKHADLAAQRTLTAKIKRLGRILRLL